MGEKDKIHNAVLNTSQKREITERDDWKKLQPKCLSKVCMNISPLACPEHFWGALALSSKWDAYSSTYRTMSNRQKVLY